MDRRHVLEVVGWAAAALLVVGGSITIIAGLFTPSASFGWFAYQPLANQVLFPGNDGSFVSRASSIGFILLSIGLIALAFLAGWRLGRKRPT